MSVAREKTMDDPLVDQDAGPRWLLPRGHYGALAETGVTVGVALRSRLRRRSMGDVILWDLYLEAIS